MEWYGFKMPEYLIDEATIQIGEGAKHPLNSIKNEDGTQKYRITIEGDGANTKAVYYNQSGNPIGQELKITIPVKVTTKWQENRDGSIIVTVKPNI
ncbi:MAG: hypothetical protein K2I99_01070 [Bacteroidaceae bacterium]|nr:hypothetical protein [Bacteroidaceae bacterium]